MNEAPGNTPDELSLDESLLSLEAPDDLITTWAFPSDNVRDAYLTSIGDRSEAEVRALLRLFLVPSGSLGADRLRLAYLDHLRQNAPDQLEQAKSKEFVRRLLRIDDPDEPPWQGLTWILDLLPHWPMRAIEVIQAYLIAHAQELPDGRISGLGDGQALVRAMWIGNPSSATETCDLLFQLGDRSFEHLVERLYSAMGFKTTLTPPRRDGGRDVIAEKDAPADKQRVLIECKLWRQPVGVVVARALLGVVSQERSTKGVIVTTSRFTKATRDLASESSRVELLGWEDLLPLLDGFLGAAWSRDVDRLIARSSAQSPEIV